MGLNPEPVRFGTFAMMGYAVITCATLEHAIKRAGLFYRLLPTAPQIGLEQDKHTAKIVIRHAAELDPDHFLSESLLVIWHRFCSWLTAQGIPLLNVECNYPAPEHQGLYKTLFATPVTFSAPQLALTIPERTLHLPVNRTPAELHNFLQHSPADLLARPNPHQSHSARVRSALGGEDIRDLPTLESMAGKLGLSGATLRRRLREEGTSYQRLKDELRCMEACRLLETTELAVSDIAHATGFSETSTFHRAFSQWMEETPTSFRKRAREDT
ncbi:MAG: AraC family transcriptional regulator, partial [Thalassolituus sp.]